MRIPVWVFAAFLALFSWCEPATALDRDLIARLAGGDSEEQSGALAAIVKGNDLSALPFLQAMLAGQVKTADGAVLILQDGKGVDPLTGAAVKTAVEAEDVDTSNHLRIALEESIAVLKLSSPDRALRMNAALFLQNGDADESRLPLIEKAVKVEKDPKIRDMLMQARAGITLLGTDRAARLAAVQILRNSTNPKIREVLRSRLAGDAESDPEIRREMVLALRNIESVMAVSEYAGLVFSGISLGSILLLAALGLAITYGLMGVINMAHGEMIMIGAYATFVVKNLFQSYLPDEFDWYLAAAAPVAFLVTALVGMAVERTVLRFLYGRSLETLLATWGLSLILMQLVRSIFGAQNVQVENPAWMSGNVALTANLVLPYNRIVIILFAVAVLGLVSWMLTKTRLGLFVRAVTQNRKMASCVGVNTGRIDTMAFGLGSGIAGLAGVALSQIGNVGPDLGQHYIVDSFMVVVLGGVGQLAGAVYAALGLGVASKLLENFSGAVLAEIALLVFIIFFIQKRPQGLFALSGRSAES